MAEPPPLGQKKKRPGMGRILLGLTPLQEQQMHDEIAQVFKPYKGKPK